jgi:hypothetical protein
MNKDGSPIHTSLLHRELVNNTHKSMIWRYTEELRPSKALRRDRAPVLASRNETQSRIHNVSFLSHHFVWSGCVMTLYKYLRSWHACADRYIKTWTNKEGTTEQTTQERMKREGKISFLVHVETYKYLRVDLFEKLNKSINSVNQFPYLRLQITFSPELEMDNVGVPMMIQMDLQKSLNIHNHSEESSMACN